MVHRFQSAENISDWISTMQSLIESLRELFIIIDLSIFGTRHGDVAHWIDEFYDTLRKPSDKKGASAKVMFLINRDPIKGSQYQLRALPMSSSTKVLLRSSPHGDPDPGSQLVITEYDLKLPELLPHHDDIQPQLPEPAQNLVQVKSGRPDKSDTSKYRRDEVGVAIVCALSLEANALEPFWDEILDEKEFEVRSDGIHSITYSVVKIAHHSVVILYMPGMGGFNAAYAFASCQLVFPGIRLAIISGICGGVPFPDKNTEVLLGDVIISDGLVSYDFGRQYPQGFERKREVADSARKMPSNISSFLSRLKTTRCHQHLIQRTACHLDAVRQRQTPGYSAGYPGTSHDVLFESSPSQEPEFENSTSEISDPNGVKQNLKIPRDGEIIGTIKRQVSRKRLETMSKAEENGEPIYPAIHFGVYGSGNKVMKSASDRDRVFHEDKVVAFEMEGVGIWDHCPCIIIKSVCDYADQHKTKEWQKYAATTAAACVKAFLEVWPLEH
ncbi:hypothetical protein PFICI_13904 [Pestalotiopsis fici W106-1]|uniref:Nucleoside phosphorylase domain-containing protein n=1 Tax=Pestalotiopsis fici (strain W106-1 / CGMCC3.15140) TaxID=1229662 RepID=W3WJI4_PESFW|nr:uncharacterized protein PFICI_13904 [Pestalotiopsis fici W106-1]ETS74038.1 hypothetical protein PFICI_13904 [Pestalotiopsis fici W106-1]